ncbi:hypothetical protein [Streptomyces sp. NPDC003688]
MSRHAHLLVKAARSYAEAGAHADAARCYDAVGWRWTAAEAYERAGDLEHAAETYRRAGHAAQAAHCYRLLGRPERAAQCWLDRNRPLEAAWELLLAGHTHRTDSLLAAADRPSRQTAGDGSSPLRLELARALRARIGGGPPEPLLTALGRLEVHLGALSARGERIALLEWGVEAADRLERFDWGARLFSAAHRPHGEDEGPDEILERWHQWAGLHLGGNAWLPPLNVRAG